MALPRFVDGMKLTASALNALIAASGVTTVPAFVVNEHPGAKLNMLRVAAGVAEFVPEFKEDEFFGAGQLNLLVDAINYGAAPPAEIQLPIADANTLGVVKIGDGFSISADGTLSVQGATSSAKFNVAVTQPGLASNAERLLVYRTSDVVTLPPGLEGSSGIALVPATATAVFTLGFNRAGVHTDIATFTFAPNGTVATIGNVVIPALVSGDVLTLFGPPVADLTLADIGFSIVGTRS